MAKVARTGPGAGVNLDEVARVIAVAEPRFREFFADLDDLISLERSRPIAGRVAATRSDDARCRLGDHSACFAFERIHHFKGAAEQGAKGSEVEPLRKFGWMVGIAWCENAAAGILESDRKFNIEARILVSQSSTPLIEVRGC